MIDTVVSQRLDNLLKGSRLSMNQIAGKWGVSAPLLSQVKNGKKKPSLELGLRILRESGASLEERKRWIEERHAEGQELGRIYRDERKERVEFALKKSIGDLFESSPVILDIFLDISLMKEKGLSWNGVFKYYGEYGLELVQTLLSTGLIEKDGDRYFTVQQELDNSVDTENSLGIMKSIFEFLKVKHRKEGFRGEFQFDITDISPEGYQKLKELNVDHAIKVAKVIEENKQPRLKGGIRVVAQNLVGLLKCFVLVSFLTLTIQERPLAQGVTGGGSGKVIEGSSLSIRDLRRVLNANLSGIKHPTRAPRDIRVRKYSDTYILEYNQAALSTPYFKTRQEAIDAIVNLNQRFKDGALSEDDAKHLTRNLPTRCSASRGGGSTWSKRVMADEFQKAGTIKALGFKVHDSYGPEGDPRFSGTAAYYIPCEEHKD